MMRLTCLPLPASRPRALALAIAVATGLGAGGAAYAQPDGGVPSTPVPPVEQVPTAPAAATPPAGAASSAGDAAATARDALKKKDTDVDQSSLLKETLTSSEKQYSLLKQGKLQTTYDVGYTYIGSQKLAANFTDGSLTQFNLENTRSHTITNTIEADYGLLDNLTGTFTVPMVSKFTQTNSFTGVTNSFGDISFGGRWQPFSLKRDGPTISLTGSLKLPTGRSPFETVQGHDMATGQGYRSGTVGVNVSKIIDPTALFGSVSLTLADAANHLHEADSSGNTLVAIKPGPTIGMGGGFAYSLSYDISTTFSFQESISLPSRLVFQTNGVTTSAHTAQQVTGILSMGLGVRVSPKTTINANLGIGLTTDSPSFTFGMNMPLNFGTIF